MRDRESREPTTVLDHLRPTVVRRRVVVDVAALNQPKPESPATAEEPTVERSSGCFPRSGGAIEDDGPPSSIMAPEAYDALGDAGDELDETEDLDDEQEEDEDRAPSTREPDPRAYAACEPAEIEALASQAPEPSLAAPPVERRPSIPVGPTIAVGAIAKRLGLPSAQVAAELVSRGFFEVTPATVLTRETARIVAEAFGRDVEEVPEPEPVKARRKRTARRAAPAKRTAKSAKPKKRTGRSTRRAA